MNKWEVDFEGVYSLKIGECDAVISPTFTQKWEAVIFTPNERIQAPFHFKEIKQAKAWASRRMKRIDQQVVSSGEPGTHSR